MNLDFDAVQEVLETRVAPQLALHGGGVKLCSISPEGDIRVAFKGACATCPSMGYRRRVAPRGSQYTP